jgi:hypothetical protein
MLKNTYILNAILFLLFATASTAQTNLQNGLIAYWSFDNGSLIGAKDTFFRLKPVENAYTAAADLRGNAIYCNPQKKAWKNSAGLGLYNNFTLSLWAKPANLTNKQSLLHQERTNDYFLPIHAIDFAIENNNLVFRYEDATTPEIQVVFALPATIKVNQWTLFTATYSGCELSLYANCTLLGSQQLHLNLREDQQQDALYIGSSVENEFIYEGYLDEIMAFDHALDAATIQLLCAKQFPAPLCPTAKKDGLKTAIGKDTIRIFSYKHLLAKSLPSPDTIFHTKNSNISIEVFDNDEADRDQISLFTSNDELLIDRYYLKKKKKTIQLTLKSKKTFLIFYAHNVGTTPPNTCTLNISDGKKALKNLQLMSEKGQNVVIAIEKD